MVISGLRVRLVDMPGAHTVGACLQIAAGSGADPARPWGTAHLSEHIRIAAAAGSGLHITGRTGNAETTFTMAGLAEQSLPIARTLARILDPGVTVDPSVFEAERAAVILESRAETANPMLLLGPAAAEAAVPGQGLSDAARATADTLGRITRAHVDDFTREHYRPGAAVLSLAGPLPVGGALRETISEALPSGAAGPSPPDGGGAGPSPIELPAELDGTPVLTVPVAGPAPFSRSVARTLADAVWAGPAVAGRATVTAARHEVIVICGRPGHAAGNPWAAARRDDDMMVDAWRRGLLRSFQEHAFAAASPLGRAQCELLDPPLHPATDPARYAAQVPAELRRAAGRARLWRVTGGTLRPATAPTEEKP
jgi:hypothetical protein